MSDSIWPTVHAERAALLADVAGFRDAEWETPSLCADWTVAQVMAHLLSLATMTPVRFVTRFAAARFDFDRYAATQITLESVDGPGAVVTAFRAAENRRTAPPGPKASWLGEAFVHGEDIRRPLGLHRTYPPAEVARAVAFYAGSNALIGGRSRVAGVTLVATDTAFTVGSGPAVEGPAISLLLATSGRPVALPELSGPGVATLSERMSSV